MAEEVDALLAALSDSDSEGDSSIKKETTSSSSQQHSSPTDDALSEYVRIESQARALDGHLRDLYVSHLPEVAEAIPDPWLYATVINTIVQGQSLETLSVSIPGSTVLTIEIAVKNRFPNGYALYLKGSNQEAPGSKELAQMITLGVRREALLGTLEAEIATMGPNILAIVQPRTAVQLLAWTGGLSGLAGTPPANLGNVGRGVLIRDDLISAVPVQYRRQAQRIVAGKIVLAARIDVAKSSPDGALGMKWRRDVDNRIDKLLAPPPPLRQRALPVPEDRPAQRRGGRKVRRYKEKHAPTETQRNAARIPFGGESTSVPNGSGLRKTPYQPSQLRVSKNMQARLDRQ